MTATTPTGREPIEIALDAIPAYRKAQAAEAAVKERLDELRKPLAGTPDFLAEVLGTLDADKPLSKDLGRRAWEAQQTGQIRQAEQQLLINAEQRLLTQRRDALHAGANEALIALRSVLDELLDEARPAAEALRGVNDAQTAIDKGPEAVTAWRDFQKYVDWYASIREAQAALTRAATGNGESITIGHQHLVIVDFMKVRSEIANVAEVWPQQDRPSNGQPARPPWPVLHPQRPWEVRHDREWLMWLLNTANVRIWLPTLPELEASYTAQTGDAKPTPRKSVKDRGGEPIRVPTRYRDGDGDTWTEWQKIEA
ncbi:hypothetical protein [Streptomyces sp. NPDC058247]|uniref:hypothetical protein n=1 Tax=Streptomyces sp. NPDC058247 TaxID=3346401 RepID=UPI0036E41EB2